jgi:eukaryotic-like serine/threonine-protein kinase
MNPPNWQKVKAVFNSALEVEASRRADYLAEACNGDDGIRGQVEELLASYHTNFLEIEKSEGVSDPNKGIKFLKPGTRLGHFEVMKLLGSGGMGEVYLTRDDRLDRSVAVKIFSLELSSNPAHLARFIREAKGNPRYEELMRRIGLVS